MTHITTTFTPSTMMYFVFVTSVVLLLHNSHTNTFSFVTAFITNNNNNGGSTGTSSPTNHILSDWIPKNTFIPKQNLPSIQQQLINTVLNIQLDMETIMATSSSTLSSLLPVQSNHHNHPNSIKSSHLLLQRLNDKTPRLPIRNIQFELTDNHQSMKPPTNDNNDVQVVGYSTKSNVAMSSVLTKTTNQLTMNTNLNKKKERSTSNSILNTIPMPGVNGPHPITSSGTLPIHIQNSGEYITLHDGCQSLPLTSTTVTGTKIPQWEVIWKEYSPMGTLICAMELQQPIQRNTNSIIPAGIMYMSFPIWDSTKLMEYQKKKINYDITVKNLNYERNHELEQMSNTNNIFAKLLHYKNAITAAENYSLQPHSFYKHIPSTIQDMISIPNKENIENQNTLLISPKGMVRIVPMSSMETATSPCGKQSMIHQMLATATSSDTKKDNKNSQHHTTKPNQYGIISGTATIRSS
jgi:hypothetical protein